MLKSTRFRLQLGLVAILLQVLLVFGDQSQPNHVKVIKHGPVRQNESKRLSAPASGELSAKSSPIKRNDDEPDKREISNKRFQARMMNEPDRAAPAQQEQPPESIKRQDAGPSGSDPWQGHALVPTFTDQDQGDEMVALASDQHEQEEVRLSRVNRSMPTREKLPVSQRGELAGEKPSQTDKIAIESANKARFNIQDEYEGEDDDEPEDEQGRLSSPGAEYEPTLSRDIKETQASQAKKFKPLSQSGLEYTDYAPQYTDNSRQTNKARQLEQAATAAAAESASNRSAGGLVRTIDSGWMPTAKGASSSNEPQTQQSAGKSSETSRPSSVGERLAGFFNGREGLNKADVAIEYLRNILKNKQSQLGNSTQTASHLQEYSENMRGQNLDSKAERVLSYDRISALTSRLNKILNATAQANGTASSEPAKLLEQIPVPNPDHSGSKQLSLQSPPADLMNGQKVRQTGSKFLISDVKSAGAQPEPMQGQLSMPSTKLPIEPAYSILPEPFSGGPLNEPMVRTSSRPPQPYLDQTAAMPANGTPLGGDYNEGLDDYPRYAYEQQQQQQAFPQQKASLLQLQSQLVPIRQEPPKIEQLPENQRQPNQAAPYLSSQLSAASAQAAGEALYQQQPPITNLPQGLLSMQTQRQFEGPRSSRYFQMHQPQAYSEVPRLLPGQNQNYQKQEGDEKPQDARTHLSSGKKVAGIQSQSAHLIGAEPAASTLRARYEEPRDKQNSIQQKLNHPEAHSPVHNSAQQEQIMNLRPVHQPTISGGKTNRQSESNHNPIPEPTRDTKPYRETQAAPNNKPVDEQQSKLPVAQAYQPAKARPPKIVSYNYFESGNEGKESELMATNYQLADALYSSTGELGQMLSQTELEAIQSQFLTAEHPMVPISAHENQPAPQPFNPQHPDSSLAGLLANLRPEDYPPPEALQKLISPAKQAEESLKELASNEQAVSALPPAFQKSQPGLLQDGPKGDELRKLLNKPLDSTEPKKRKSLIVYLNHPRPVDMSKSAPADEGHNLAQSVSDQPLESFISAKEFDTQGLSKETKHLDVSSLRGFDADSKEGQDKDGLSVVVIGDAYKYKKIVLLISSKSGGLKFIPMVKDMKR